MSLNVIHNIVEFLKEEREKSSDGSIEAQSKSDYTAQEIADKIIENQDMCVKGGDARQAVYEHSMNHAVAYLITNPEGIRYAAETTAELIRESGIAESLSEERAIALHDVLINHYLADLVYSTNGKRDAFKFFNKLNQIMINSGEQMTPKNPEKSI